MIKNVYIRTRPGADSTISESMLIAVGDTVRHEGFYVIQDREEIDQHTLVLALGGDGTMLSAIHIAAEKGAYVTGFNYGNLGYLVPDYAKSVTELTGKLTDVLRGSEYYKITDYKLPLLMWQRQLRRQCHFAVNDFYFVPAANGSAADFHVAVGKDVSFFQTKSSGIVVATPFGSTGLALSAGGSVISPNSNVLEIVPMLPHTLTSRPIIVPNSDTITISWERRINVFADGRLIDDFGEGKIELKCKKRKINLIQPSQWDFFENLKHKMKWHS